VLLIARQRRRGHSSRREMLWCNAHCAGHTEPRMSFFDRNRKELIEKGYDPARLPPGQYLTDRFPVLHVGDVPDYRPGDWSLTIDGLVDRPFTLDLDELKAMPAATSTFDIHCVTKWSKFDTTWTGVRVRDLFDRAGVRPEATHVMEHAEYGYTTNLPLADITTDEAIVAYAFEGEPIEPIHGGPVRIVVPHLYFWKSAKWVRRLELRNSDEPGFWERNGYHNYGDPFTQQRYWGD
jgi:DMSO/TMAO reductase YedYZ molybdopterin-dependent catalytic subunit